MTFYGSTFYPDRVHFQWCILNLNKITVFLCFYKLICKFLLICFKVRMCKISEKSDNFLLNYSSLRRGPLFSGHSVAHQSAADPQAKPTNLSLLCLHLPSPFSIIQPEGIRPSRPRHCGNSVQPVLQDCMLRWLLWQNTQSISSGSHSVVWSNAPQSGMLPLVHCNLNIAQSYVCYRYLWHVKTVYIYTALDDFYPCASSVHVWPCKNWKMTDWKLM